MSEISDEMVRAFNRAFNEAYDRLGDDEPYGATRAGLSAALVASGWRPQPEGRVELGAAHGSCEHWDCWSTEESLNTWLAACPGWRPLRRIVLATALEPVDALPQCACPLIDTSVPGGPPEFVLGDPAGCKVHGQARDAEIQARDAEIEAAKRRARAATGYTAERGSE